MCKTEKQESGAFPNIVTAMADINRYLGKISINVIMCSPGINSDPVLVKTKNKF